MQSTGKRCQKYGFLTLLIGWLVIAEADAQNNSDTENLKQAAEALKNEQYQVALELSNHYPNEFDVLRVMGFAHSSHGNLDEMFQCWERCRKLRPDRADIYDQLGRYSFQIEDYAAAIKYWEDAIRVDSKYPGLHRQMGNARLSLGQLEKAQSALEREVAISPNDFQSRYLLGEVFFQRQRFEYSRACYLSAVTKNPNHANSYYGLIKVSARLGKTDELAKYSKRFQDLENAASATDLDYRRNFDDLQQMREKLAVTCVDAGRIYLTHQNATQAETLWKRAAEVDKKNSISRSLLVTLFIQKKDTPNTVRYLKELTSLEPDNVANFQKLGYLQARMQNFAGAETSFKTAVKLAPNQAIGYRDLAKFYLNTKRRPTEAKRFAERALQLEPVADSHFVLGWANAVTGDRKSAVTSLSKAIELAPENQMYRRLYDSVVNAKPK